MSASTRPGAVTAPEVVLDVDAAVDDALRILELEHGRSAQRELGASEIGECARLLKWTVEGRSWTDPDSPSLVAEIGTALHARLLPALARATGDPFALVEQPVVATIGGLRIPGTLDLFAHRTVVDLKTVYALDRVRRDGPTVVQLAQLATYVEGLRQAGERVDAAELLYVDRAHGERHVVHVSEQELEDVLAVLEAFIDSALYPPDGYGGDAPRVDVTGRDRRSTDSTCGYCRFRSACWGDPPRPAVLLDEGLELAEALAGYVDAAARKSAAEKDREWWGLVLEDTPAGDYAAGFRVKRKRGTAPAEVLDAPAAERALLEAGLDVPRKWNNGRRGSLEVVPL